MEQVLNVTLRQVVAGAVFGDLQHEVLGSKHRWR